MYIPPDSVKQHSTIISQHIARVTCLKEDPPERVKFKQNYNRKNDKNGTIIRNIKFCYSRIAGYHCCLKTEVLILRWSLMTILCYLNNSKNVRGEKCEKRLVKENWAETKSNFVLVCTCQKVALLSYFPLSVTALVFDLEQISSRVTDATLDTVSWFCIRHFYIKRSHNTSFVTMIQM